MYTTNMLTNNDIKNIPLKDLGFNEFFILKREQLGLTSFPVARVIAEHKGSYGVKSEVGEYVARVTGKQMFQASSREDYPAVGDWIATTDPSEGQAAIYKVLPRKTTIKRKSSNKNEIQIIAANVDVTFIVESVDRDYNLNRFERYFSLVSGEGMKLAIILNKIDLISTEALDLKIAEIKNRFHDIDIIPTSTTQNTGLDLLKNYLEPGKTYCFLGSSGVGKSSLINNLLGETVAKTADIGVTSDRGKHITTSRQMYFLNNGSMVIDNPGMREVGMTYTSTNIDDVFDEIAALSKKCKYKDCTHTNEQGCAILLAVAAHELDKNKYSNYLNLKKEADSNKLASLRKKEKSRKFGKFLKQANDDLKEYGNTGY